MSIPDFSEELRIPTVQDGPLSIFLGLQNTDCVIYILAIQHKFENDSRNRKPIESSRQALIS
jgi:hypothetical protein